MYTYSIYEYKFCTRRLIISSIISVHFYGIGLHSIKCILCCPVYTDYSAYTSQVSHGSYKLAALSIHKTVRHEPLVVRQPLPH